ncbi:chondroitinase-B domain-containing protein [Carboxylicivirga sp. M1479]|uniref:chondroitinase-B domain-containing protein n=1 Tax=Carboxylicivirga sp. M1479 TaxID=2594476 RepID=UPI001177C050|nr:chondroitinase-B domain-containing protein [Carboxylicivirga sp. M1479]TRX72654.1 alginate lyase [Carboxylicivirga sp. M1479]
MNKILILLAVIVSMGACQLSNDNTGILVQNKEELKAAIKNAMPGDNIIMANGVWTDVEIKFTGKGTKDAPIVIKAQTAGEVFIEGVSCLKFGGKYLEVHGLYFRNGYTPSNAVIDFKLNKEQLANHCRVSHCVIKDFNQMSRDRKDHWVEFWGRHNQLDHCYLSGKSNEGPTVRVDIKGNRSINNYHQIIHNHFGPRPRKGGPKAETIQLGDSFSSMSPSYTTVAYNLFERCNGEVEIISSKTNFNEFRNNVFYKSEGSLVTRHGNYCTIDGNYFIGDDNSENIGGIRIINTGHKVSNNYFYNLKGKSFRSPLAVMNGIPKSPLNRYNQVTDVVVAYNTWVNCASPWQFGVGTNISQSEVLPKSEIRSARPLRTLVANNIIYNATGDAMPIVEHDKADGVLFKSNVINNQDVDFAKRDGLVASSFEVSEKGKGIWVPGSQPGDVEPYMGFEFELFTKDVTGQVRDPKTSLGAFSAAPQSDLNLLDKTKYGASWYKGEASITAKQTEVDASSFKDAFDKASEGDVLILNDGAYKIESSLVVNKTITIKAKNSGMAELIYSGEKETAAFEMHPKGNLTLKYVKLNGQKTQYAFASLKKNMSSHYILNVEGCDISNFDYVLKAYKQSFAEEITFEGTAMSDCANGLELSQETNDKGDYNVEFLTINNCHFKSIASNVVDYYRGGYDESTIGGNLLLSNCSFTKCGAKEKNGILINTRGIVNVNINNNSFKNNRVKLVALLWGAKNNIHANNKITNSGKIVVEENLKLKLVY